MSEKMTIIFIYYRIALFLYIIFVNLQMRLIQVELQYLSEGNEMKKLYIFTIQVNDDEEYLPILAYSYEQALLLLSLKEEDILDYEIPVNKCYA